MRDHEEPSPKLLRAVGGMWKPHPGAKSLYSGSVTVNGLKQRFVILENYRKVPGSRQPDFLMMSSEQPEPDTYTPRQPTAATHQHTQPPVASGHSRAAQVPADVDPAGEVFDSDEIPFAWLLPILVPALGLLGSVLA